MGSRRLGKAVIVAAALCAGARAGASVQVDPIARLSLESGYDSNAMYDGRGQALGRVSPDLGLQLRDHTWNFTLEAGGDLLAYPGQVAGSHTVWNQRGHLVLHARPEARLKIDVESRGTYAFDPVGLARLGIFNQGTAGLVVFSHARVAYLLDHDWAVAGLLDDMVVHFDNATGNAAHSPGVEVTKQVDRRFATGGGYRFDFFQSLTAGVPNATAHELQWVGKWRWTRWLSLEGEIGPALWVPAVGSAQVLPHAMAQLLGATPRGDVRVTVRHGVGLGLVGTPGLFDSLEGALTRRLTRRWTVHVEGGLWRSGEIPWGANALLGYGAIGEVSYLVGSGVRLGLGASRFATLDTGSSLYDRNIIGLRVGWELKHR